MTKAITCVCCVLVIVKAGHSFLLVRSNAFFISSVSFLYFSCSSNFLSLACLALSLIISLFFGQNLWSSDVWSVFFLQAAQYLAAFWFSDILLNSFGIGQLWNLWVFSPHFRQILVPMQSREL